MVIRPAEGGCISVLLVSQKPVDIMCPAMQRQEETCAWRHGDPTWGHPLSSPAC